MIKISLNITEQQRVELAEHLKLNGYSVDWETESILLVDADEVEYIKTILLDRKIPFYYMDTNVIEEAKNCLKKKLVSFYRLAEEILALSSPNDEYSDEEEELFEEVANVVNVFDNFIQWKKGMTDYGKVVSENGTSYSYSVGEKAYGINNGKRYIVLQDEPLMESVHVLSIEEEGMASFHTEHIKREELIPWWPCCIKDFSGEPSKAPTFAELFSYMEKTVETEMLELISVFNTNRDYITDTAYKSWDSWEALKKDSMYQSTSRIERYSYDEEELLIHFKRE